MPNYSTSYRFELPLSGERPGTWGDMMNTFMGTLLEDVISGISAVSMSNADYTLVFANAPTPDETRRMILNVTSTVSLTATRDIIIPSVRKLYSVFNNTTGGQAIRVRTSSSTIIVTIPSGRRRFIFCDGTNTFDFFTDLPSGVTANGVEVTTASNAQTLTNKTISAPTITSPTLTVRDNALTIQDDLDNSKQARFEVSSISPSTIRTITVPNADLTLVGTDTAQTLTNKTLTTPAISSISNGGTVTVPTGNVTLATRDGAETLTNKTLTSPTINTPTINTPTITVRDNALTLQDDADNTKQARFQLSAISSGQIRTVTLPDGDFTAGASPVTQVTGAYTVQQSDRAGTFLFNSGAGFTLTLPVFASGFYFFGKNIGAGTITITPQSGTISGGTSLTLRTGEWAFVVSGGSNHEALHTGQAVGAPSVREIGTRGVPVIDRNASFTFALSDAGSIARHSDGSAYTYTIPANGSVAFPVGTAITIVNEPSAGNITVSITTDTLNRGDGVAGTGNRTITANSVATCIKTSATTWMITGSFT